MNDGRGGQRGMREKMENSDSVSLVGHCEDLELNRAGT